MEGEVRKTLHRALALSMSFTAVLLATEGWTADQSEFTPDQIKWGPMPSGLPSGAQSAVLSGDPASSGAFIIRVKSTPPRIYGTAPPSLEGRRRHGDCWQRGHRYG